MSFKLIPHPRSNSKSIECSMGLHQWQNLILGGRPLLICSRCGANIFKEVKEKTYTVGTESKLFEPHNTLLEQRRLLLKKRILEAIDPKEKIRTSRP